jgi:hypothetical protein
MRAQLARASLAALAILGVLPVDAGASPRSADLDYIVAEASLTRSLGEASVNVSRVDDQLCINPSVDFYVCLPRWSALSPTDVGSTVWIDAETPPGTNLSGLDGVTSFDDFVGYITNGEPDWIVAGLDTGGASGGGGESEADFFGVDAGPSGVDLAGYVIDRIGFRVDALSIDSPRSDPNHDGIWTDVSLSGTYLFEGRIAHPGACARGGWESLHAPGGARFQSLVACIRSTAGHGS